MKNLKYLLLVIILILFTGCSTPKYNDNFRVQKIINDVVYGQPDYIYVKYIKEGNHTENYYYTYGLNTIYTPKGDTKLKQEHLKFFYDPPKTEYDKKVFSIILHENAHMINRHKVKYNLLLQAINILDWTNEREAYQVEIRYRVLSGILVDKDGFIRSMTNEAYNKMATEKQVKEFVEKVVADALIEKSNY